MSDRARLPNRRPSWRRKLQWCRDPSRQNPMTFFLTVSFFPRTFSWLAQWHWVLDSTRPYELFIDCAKQDSDQAIQAEAAAIYASLALQFGCPLETLLKSAPRNEPTEEYPEGSFGEVVGHCLGLIAEGKVI
jgi:hypothetical protein